MKTTTMMLLSLAALPASAMAQMSQPMSSGQTTSSGQPMSSGQMSSGQAMSSDPSMASTAALSPDDYVMQAGASDLFEKTSSKLVLGSKDPKVRQFAQQMIKDHTTSTNQVKAAAMKDQVKVMPPKLNSMQADMVAQLRAATGTARDQLYMQQQAQSHQMALQLQQGYAANGSATNLKAAAAGIVPVVQNHIAMLGSGSTSGM